MCKYCDQPKVFEDKLLDGFWKRTKDSNRTEAGDYILSKKDIGMMKSLFQQIDNKLTIKEKINE